MAINCSLGDKDCDNLNMVLRDAPTVMEYLQKCKEAGIPCEQFEEVLNKQHAMAQGIKRVFFPNRS